MAEAKGLSNTIKRTLECSVCLQMYNLKDKLPQNLRCGHSFCKSCIGSLKGESSVITCPKCRKDVSTDDVVTTFGITDVLEALCELCISHDRAGKCHHCKQMLCLTCLDKHAVAYRKELLTNLDDLDDVIQRVADVSSEPKVWDQVKEKIERTFGTIRETINKRRQELDKLEQELEDKVTTLQQENKEQCTVWKESLEKEITRAKQFQSKSRDILGDANTEKCTREEMSTIDTDYQTMLSKLQNLQESHPIINDYHFEEISDVSQLQIGQLIVSGSPGATSLCKSLPTPGQSADIYKIARFKCMTGSLGSGPDDFNKPFFVACMDDRIIVTDTYNHRIKVYDYNLHLMHIEGKQGDNPYQLNGPVGVAVTEDQEIIVSDTSNHRIKVLNKYCGFIKVFGKPGGSEQQYNGPWALCVRKNNTIYVNELQNKRIKVVKKDGSLVCNIGHKGPGAGLIQDTPIDVAVHKDRILVSENGYPLLKVYSVTGEYITSYPQSVTDLPVADTIQPLGIAVDHNDNIIFANRRGQLIVLNEVGEFVCTIGEPGDKPGQLHLPWGVAVTPQSDIVVCDQNNHRIQIYQVI